MLIDSAASISAYSVKSAAHFDFGRTLNPVIWHAFRKGQSQLSSLATILKNIGLRIAVEVREPKVA